jgi:hypothetical protein
MKINQIVGEVGAYQQGKAAMTKLMSPSQWSAGANYNKGKAAATKLMSPSQWGKSSNTAAPAAPTVPPYAKRQSLINASAGKPLYHDDVAALKSALNDNPDAASAEAIKLAYSNKPLTKDQRQLLANMSKKY